MTNQEKKSPTQNRKASMNRRLILKGLGGVSVALPLLEGLRSKDAKAADTPEPYAFFLRQANGVATAQDNGSGGSEPERFWPRNFGALNAANVDGRALDELTDYLDRCLVLGNVNMENFDYADGHARGALQCLTARGPVVAGAAGDSEAAGESLDHRIGRQLNADGNDSLFMYAGSPGGWLGGPCISYRGANDRRSALHNPWNAYQTLFGGQEGLSEQAVFELQARNRSVNDLVRGQIGSLMNSTKLSQGDRDRLDLHLTSIRDAELTLSCQMSESEQMVLQGLEAIYESGDGNDVLAVAKAHMDLSVIALTCGLTRSACLQIGGGNDGGTRYRDPDTGQEMENYHFISHRRFSHGDSGDLIANADLLHHKIDRTFAQTFRYLLGKLEAYDFDGQNFLDLGVSVWLNDLGNGPGHSSGNCPYVLAGSANGFFRQGEYVELDDGRWDALNHARLLNTIATAVGCTTGAQSYCNDLGDSGLSREPLTELS